MSIMIAEVYDAFLSAGATEDKARKASEALANYESRFIKIESDIVVLKWMCGTILAGIVALVLKAFFHI
jgi:hypothetical protein